jgi:hypothetical protein
MTEKIEDGLQALSLEEKYEIINYTVENLIMKEFNIFLPRLPGFLDTIEKELNITLDKSKLKLKENDIIDLTENMFIQDPLILKALLTFLGSINFKNDFTQFTADTNSDLADNIYLEKNSFKKHLDMNIDTIFSLFKMRDLTLFSQALAVIGIPITSTDLYTKIKKYVMGKDKILLIITPSNNFWIKSEKDNINGKQYDKKLNNYNNIYYYWYFVRKFYERVANHPRCVLGILSSMISKNLKPCIEFISIDVGSNFTKFVVFEQNTHDNLEKNEKAKPIFIRSLDKIIGNTKGIQEWSFNETNIVIVESEVDKMEKTKNNSIVLSCFDENYFDLPSEEKKESDAKVDRFINNLVKMFEECETDVREYIAKNDFN